MSDTYQAVYDATRSRISNGDIGSAVESVMREANFAFYVERAFMNIAESAGEVACEKKRPSALYRPSIGLDGNKWCALYGVNLMEGVCGFGDSPAEAMADFDAEWVKKYEDRKPAA